VLAVLSLAIMPPLAYAKQRTGNQMGSRALVVDSIETWVCSYLSLSLLAGVELYALFSRGGPTPWAALATLPVILWRAAKLRRRHENTTRTEAPDGSPAEEIKRTMSSDWATD
jgi:hypothetical protein